TERRQLVPSARSSRRASVRSANVNRVGAGGWGRADNDLFILQSTKKGRRSSDRRPQPAPSLSPYTAVFVFDLAGKISLNAVMNRAISSAVPIDTRMCFVIGGNGRPTATFFAANSWMTGWISRPIDTMKKLVSDGRHS